MTEPFPPFPRLDNSEQALILTPGELLAIRDAALILILMYENDVTTAIELTAVPEGPYGDGGYGAMQTEHLDSVREKLDVLEKPRMDAVRAWHDEVKAWEDRNGPIRSFDDYDLG